MLMLLEFFFWWYGPGWKQAWKQCFLWVKNVQLAFSVDVLLKTLFSPWKRIVALPGRSIDEKFKGMIDNLVSRVIGFIVRLIALVAAVVMIIITAIAGLVMAVLWPLLPALGVGLIIWGIIG
jgi:hypothetical protein